MRHEDQDGARRGGHDIGEGETLSKTLDEDEDSEANGEEDDEDEEGEGEEDEEEGDGEDEGDDEDDEDDEDEEEDEEDEEDAEAKPATRKKSQPDPMVLLQIRSTGIRGPVPRSGRRGLLMFQGHVPKSLVTWLPQLQRERDAARCEALFIYADDEIVLQSKPTKREQEDATQKAIAEQEKTLKKLANKLARCDEHERAARIKLEVLEQKVSSGQRELAQIDRQVADAQQHLETVRANAAAEEASIREGLIALRKDAQQERQMLLHERSQLSDQLSEDRKRMHDDASAARQRHQQDMDVLQKAKVDMAEMIRREMLEAVKRAGLLEDSMQKQVMQSMSNAEQIKVRTGAVAEGETTAVPNYNMKEMVEAFFVGIIQSIHAARAPVSPM